MPTSHTEPAPDLAVAVVDDDVIDVDGTEESVYVPSTDLVPAPPAATLVRPVGTPTEIAEAFTAYAQACDTLLDESDYQSVGNKKYRTKSAWRKLAVAYGVNIVLISQREERRHDDGSLLRSIVTVRAVAPNGRAVDGIGACDLFERCCAPECRNSSQYHRHCPRSAGEPCIGWSHFSHAEHDLHSTAYTRAANRACADLFGLGEVSAEEMDGRRDAGAEWASADTLRSIRRAAVVLARDARTGGGSDWEGALIWPTILGTTVFDAENTAPLVTEDIARVVRNALEMIALALHVDLDATPEPAVPSTADAAPEAAE